LAFSKREWEVITKHQPVVNFTILASSSNAQIQLSVNNLKIRAHRHRTALPLAEISCNRINLEAVRNLLPDVDTEWEEAIGWLRGKTIQAGISSPIPSDKPISRHLLPEAGLLEKWGVITPSTSETLISVLAKVPKAGGKWSRLIHDLRPLNAILPKPGPMRLPDLHMLIDELLTCNYAFQADAKSYFYQFTIDEEARKFFGARLGGARGRFVQYSLLVMSMGYSQAPRIAQITSNRIAKATMSACKLPVLLPWVDNFLGGAHTLADAKEGAQRLMDVCKVINLELKEPPTVSQTLDAVGLRFTLGHEAHVTLSEDSRHSLGNWSKPLSWTTRSLLNVFGLLMWATYAVGRHPLCHKDRVLQVIRKQAIMAAQDRNGFDWDAEIDLDYDAEDMLKIWTREAAEYKYTLNPRDSSEPIEAWSDASKAQSARLGYLAELTSREGNMVDAPPIDIYILELLAAADLLQTLDKIGRPMRIHIDNTTAAAILRKGHSTAAGANIIMARLTEQLTQQVTIITVPSACQRADLLSRGQWLATPICQHHHSSSIQQWVRTHKDKTEEEEEERFQWTELAASQKDLIV